jgi:hypothetical protein
LNKEHFDRVIALAAQRIADLGAKHDELGAAWSFIGNRRSLTHFKAYL